MRILANLFHKILKTGIALLLLCISYPIMGQVNTKKIDSTKIDSTKVIPDSLAVYYFVGSVDSLKANHLHFIDTTLTYFHQYNPDEHGNQMYGTLNNIGLPSYNRVFSPDLTPGYIFLPNSLNHILFSNNEVRYYLPEQPYTDLHYVMGPKKQQNLGVSFNRRITRRFTLGMRLWIINSPGIYDRSFTKDNNFYLTGQYYTKNRRYGIIANYIYNQDKFQESGGFKYDSIFQLHQESDPSIIPVQLSDAQNKIKTNGFYVEQYFNLSPPDTNKTKKARRLFDAGSISYAFEYKKNYLAYSDGNAAADSLFYQAFPPLYNLSGTYDSIYQVHFRNTFKWSSVGYNESKLSQVFHLSFGIHLDHIEQKLMTLSPFKTLPSVIYIDSTKLKPDYLPETNSYSEATTFGNLSLWLFKRSYLDAHGQITFGGYNNGDFELVGGLMQYLGSEKKNIGKLRFNIKIINRMPAWYFSHYHSNRFDWKQDLKKERFLILGGEYQYKKINLGVRMQTLNNYTYYNDSVAPTQNLQTGTVLQIYGNGTIPIRSFGIDFRGVYQTTSMKNCIHLPVFTGMLDLYFKNWVFHHHGKLQTGIQLSYFTRYYADSYMPELRAFYVQNITSIGDYLMASFYATLKVKTFRMFVKVTNLRGYSGIYNYYSTPHYPDIAPGVFFGVTWRFHN